MFANRKAVEQMPFFMETETARINRLIRAGVGAGLTELEFFAREIVAWEKSAERREQMAGERYYSGDHDILKRRRETTHKRHV